MSTHKKLPTVIKYMLVGALLLLGVKYFETLLGLTNDLFDVISPLILGVAIAYILNILVTALEKIYFPNQQKAWITRTRRPICIVLALISIIGIVLLLFVIVIPQLISAFKVLFENVPTLITHLQNAFNEMSADYPTLQEYSREFNLDLQSITKSALNGIASLLTGLFSSSMLVAGTLTGWIVNFVIGLIFAIYILLSKEKLKKQAKLMMKAYMKPHLRNELYMIAGIANDSFSSYITGQCMEAIILGSLCAIGMWLFRFPYAGMIGTFIGATAFIPIVGAYIGATLGVIMILTVSPIKALFFIVYILVLQQLENNLIYPKVVGASIGLPGMWVLAAVTIGGGLGGILGMIIGVPLAATLYKLLKIFTYRRLHHEESDAAH